MLAKKSLPINSDRRKYAFNSNATTTDNVLQEYQYTLYCIVLSIYYNHNILYYSSEL